MRSRYAASCRTSSPLTRGKLDVHAARVQFHGLIPTHAGRTETHSYERAPSTDHPRSRGENQLSHADLEGIIGSSPLTRGKPRRRQTVPELGGLIPAHAGKTGKSACS